MYLLFATRFCDFESIPLAAALKMLLLRMQPGLCLLADEDPGFRAATFISNPLRAKLHPSPFQNVRAESLGSCFNVCKGSRLGAKQHAENR